jgi:hypothetical protein
MRLLPCLLLGFSLCSAARADTFWLSDPKATLPPGATHRTVVGVLLAQSDEGYHVRIVGGEVLLPKAMVFQIDKDPLSLDDILQQERTAAAQTAAAEAERRAAAAHRRTAAEASARRTEIPATEVPATGVPAAGVPANGAGAQDASASTGAEPAAPLLDPDHLPQLRRGYDPVLHRYVAAPGQMTRAELRRELAFAWRTTRDPRYLDALRQLR